MARITISSRLKAAPELAAFVDSYGVPLAAGLNARLFGEDGSFGGSTNGVLEALRGLRNSVGAAGRELGRRHEEVLAQQREARAVRRRRDRALERVRWLLVRYRKTFQATYGLLAVETHLGLLKKTSEDPVLLLRQARRAQALLQGAALPQPQVVSFEIDPEVYAARLARETDLLETTLGAAVYARRSERAAVLARKQVARAFDELYRPACRWLAALCELAGMAEHSSLIPMAGKGLAHPRSSLVGGTHSPLAIAPTQGSVVPKSLPPSLPTS